MAGEALIAADEMRWWTDRRNPPGDVVSFEPNEKQWHGAMLAIAMTHLAIQEALDGKVVE